MRILASQGYNRYGWMLGALWSWHWWSGPTYRCILHRIAPFHNLEGEDVRSAVARELRRVQARDDSSYPTSAEYMWLEPLCRPWFPVQAWFAWVDIDFGSLLDLQREHLGYEPVVEATRRARVYRWLRRLRLRVARRALLWWLQNTDVVERVMRRVAAAERQELWHRTRPTHQAL
jgi:hypothetical protein